MLLNPRQFVTVNFLGMRIEHTQGAFIQNTEEVIVWVGNGDPFIIVEYSNEKCDATSRNKRDVLTWDVVLPSPTR